MCHYHTDLITTTQQHVSNYVAHSSTLFVLSHVHVHSKTHAIQQATSHLAIVNDYMEEGVHEQNTIWHYTTCVQ